MDIYNKAVSSSQYDLQEVSWIKEATESPFRRFFYDALVKYKNTWDDASILEIGCGTGWLLNLLKGQARFAEGIDPSKNNIHFANENYLGINTHIADFESFKTTREYNIIISIMAFSHIGDISSTFNKIFSLLIKKGELQIIVPDYFYFRMPRFGYKINIQEISEDEYAVKIVRDYGILADVVRTNDFYIKKAANAGLNLIEAVPMYPSQYLIEKEPKYKEFENTPMFQILRFRKS